MYYVVRASAPSLHRESTDSLIVTLRTVSLSVASIEPCNYNTCNWQESKYCQLS